MIPCLLQIRADGFEFELEMILSCKYSRRSIICETIETIYRSDNSSSHFNPFLDSMKIYFILLRFTFSSLLAALVDNLVFIMTQLLLLSVAQSQIVARAVSAGVNYAANRRLVFHSHEQVIRTLPRYILLVLASGVISYHILMAFHNWLGMHIIVAKITAEGLVFFVNFIIQRDLVFFSKSR